MFIELFKDANATQPLVVTSLIGNWKKYYRVKVTGHSDNTIETTGSTLFAGVSSIKIYSGQLSYINRGGSTNTWFEILTSGNYVKI